jgi:acetyl-CoA acetyltransferase
MEGVYIAGAAMTAFGKFPDVTVRSLTAEAVTAALRDAQLEAPDVQMVFFANAAAGLITGQEMIRGQSALWGTGLLGVPIVNVENACASASTAFHLACGAVASGQVEVALAVGAEKMAVPDKTRALAAIGTAIDLERREELEAIFGDGSPGPDRSLFMDIYAALTRAYAVRSGATPADFAEVAVKSHDHAALNPKAQYRGRVTVEQVLGSRMISDPLTLLMCSPIGDGAAAVVVTRRDRLPSAGPRVRVAASVLRSGREREPHEPTALQLTARQAYETAGLGPADLDVIEVHDAAAPAELMAYEELELCPEGEAAKLLRCGHTRLGGRQVVNASGGLLSKGHPIGATGCAQIVELADQLRDRCGDRQVEGARVALAENAGGFLGTDNAALAITILAAEAAP